jgi:hypothetical protein
VAPGSKRVRYTEQSVVKTKTSLTDIEIWRHASRSPLDGGQGKNVTPAPCPVYGVCGTEPNDDEKRVATSPPASNDHATSSIPTSGTPRTVPTASNRDSSSVDSAEATTHLQVSSSTHTSARVRFTDPGTNVRRRADGLEPPVLNSTEPVTGDTTPRLRIENKRRRRYRQLHQAEQVWWTKYRGDFACPQALHPPNTYRNKMCPRGLALHHPAAATLLKYATKGCPTMTGRPWTVRHMTAAITRGPHASALVPAAVQQMDDEIAEKVKNKQVRLVRWADIKANPPRQLKISPLAMVEHKSRPFRAILDLSFPVKISPTETVPAVNSTTTKTAPAGSINQLGHSLNRIIHAFAASADDAKIFMAKWDIKDGFWRLDCEEGEEWNFAYVLPSSITGDVDDVILVIPTSLQMGWIESPPYFCAASETARDVAATYAELPMNKQQRHRFLPHTTTNEDYNELPEHAPDNDDLLYMLEVFVDDFIGLVIPASREQLDHVASAMMHGIHDVFPPDPDCDADPISNKKLRKGDAEWANVKEILGMTFDGTNKTIWLATEKRDALIASLHTWIRLAKRQGGILFDEFRSVMSKLQHAFITIPAGRGLLSPFYTLLAIHPKFVFLHRNQALFNSVVDCRTFLRESVSTPTKCKNLVPGWPDYIGITDASGYGAGGCVIGENKAVPPTVFRFQWPTDITNDIVSDKNPNGRITNSDLEMAGLLLLWLVMEDVCPTVADAHVALFSDNSPTVHWVQRLAAKHSQVAMQLVRALSLRLQRSRASPLTPLHIAGVDNSMTDIPSRSFGSEPKWHCKSHSDLLTLFNTTFPLPQQASWTVYHPSSAITTRVTSILRMKLFTADEWRRLPKAGKNIGTVGCPTSRLWEWTLTYRKPTLSIGPEPSPDLQHESGVAHMVEDGKSGLERSLAHSRPLARRFPWSQDQTQQN